MACWLAGLLASRLAGLLARWLSRAHGAVGRDGLAGVLRLLLLYADPLVHLAPLRQEFLREMVGAPKNPAPSHHFWVWIVKPSGCHCTDAFGGQNIVECRPLIGALPFSHNFACRISRMAHTVRGSQAKPCVRVRQERRTCSCHSQRT